MMFRITIDTVEFESIDKQRTSLVIKGTRVALTDVDVKNLMCVIEALKASRAEFMAQRQ